MFFRRILIFKGVIFSIFFKFCVSIVFYLAVLAGPFAMKYIAAYLLSKAAGNEKPTVDQVKAILAAGGVEIDDAKVQEVVTKMNEKSVEELVEAGKADLAKVSGGAAPAAGSSTAAAAPAEEAKKEEEPEPEVSLALDDMFGDF